MFHKRSAGFPHKRKGMMYMDEKNTEQAYLASVDNNGIFENRASDAYPQTIVADLIRAHLQSGGEKRKKVLLFGFDGARADSMIYLIPSTDPDLTGHNLRSRYSAIADLKEQGGLYLTYAGGDPARKETLQETSTAQGWAAILTGKWGIENGVVNHVTKRADCPTVLMEAAQKGMSALFASIWPDHFTITYRQEMEQAAVKALPLTFRQVADEDALQQMLLDAVDADADVIFGINEFADYNGHGSGFGSENYRYVVGITNSDRCAYEVIAHIKARPTYKEEDWLLLITSDHGGHGYGHGTQQIEDRMTFLAVNKPLLPMTEK